VTGISRRAAVTAGEYDTFFQPGCLHKFISPVDIIPANFQSRIVMDQFIKHKMSYLDKCEYTEIIILKG
jgi:hypothetical protein